MRRLTLRFAVLVGLSVLIVPSVVRGQSFGIELHNTLMPAAGAMGGVSIARPQDTMSAINANPATLSQFEGTQFTIGGAWAEPTYNLSHTGGLLPRLGTFSAKSEAEGSVLGGFGLTQDLRALDMPVTVGLGLSAAAGAGLSFRNVPESDGTGTTISVLQLTSGAGVDLTDRLSAGAAVALGTGGMDPPFRRHRSLTRMTTPCAARSDSTTIWAIAPIWASTIKLGRASTLMTRFSSNCSDGTYDVVADVNMDLPNNIGLGIANRSLLDGRLLLAADVLYKQWDNAALFKTLYDNQWVLQLGAQYAMSPRVVWRGIRLCGKPDRPDSGSRRPAGSRRREP